MANLINFLINNIPDWQTTLLSGPIMIGWSYCYLRLVGYLKQSGMIKPDYTRKLFHIMAFLTAFILQNLYGQPIVVLYGLMTALVVAYGVLRGEAHPLYQAMARDKDRPFTTYFIVVPFIAALIGGLISNALFGPVAIVGYLVVGFGDAAGELVGVRWGRHHYVVPTLAKIKTTRSFEGSLGVMVVSTVAAAIALMITPEWSFTIKNLCSICLIGFASAILEGISPHGWDNATMQIVPTLLSSLLCR